MGKKHIYEIFFSNPSISLESWQEFLLNLRMFIGIFHSWKIVLYVQNNEIRYFLFTSTKLPPSLNTTDFIMKESNECENLTGRYAGHYFRFLGYHAVDFINQFYKRGKQVEQIQIKFFNLFDRCLCKSKIIYRKNDTLYTKKILVTIPDNILCVDFLQSKNFYYKKMPKYLNIQKIIHFLNNQSENALLQVDTFPYLDDNFYLRHDVYDFYGHSLVIGSSGSGKSKFLSLLISNILKFQRERYRIVVIDPHDALKYELAGIPSSRVFDFQSQEGSVDLFSKNIDDVNAFVELSLSLFQNLIHDGYNSKLERVLRFSTYLLIVKDDFSFIHLRKLLLDMDYRNNLVDELKMELPASVSQFFLTEFNELKTKSYNEAIAPIISFIDEMQLIPVFNEETKLNNIKNMIQDNSLSIFSFNRLNLGDKVTKTIAGFLMQQIFLLAQGHFINEHLILVIDEVSVLENPILARFLSELRKYQTSVILAGQYFHQISPNLREAILSNTNNYYLFRVSKSDAEILENNLQMKLEVDDSKENRINFLTSLKNRECLVRISQNGTMYPLFKAKTVDFKPAGIYEQQHYEQRKIIENKQFDFHFSTDDVNITDIMKSTSTSRKKE